MNVAEKSSNVDVELSYIRCCTVVFSLCVQKSFYHICQNDIFTSNIHKMLIIMIVV